MADDTILNPGVGGDVIRDIEKSGRKTQAIVVDFGGDGAEDLTPRAYGAGAATATTPRVVLADSVLTAGSPDAATVGTGSAEAVAANASRKGLILVNTSTARISLGFGSPAVLDSGVTLYPGGSYEMGAFDFSLDAVNAIASAGSSNLAIQEYS